jgi:hypothetical protein
MKLGDVAAGTAQVEESKWTLPYPASSIAEPAITLAEALAVDPGRDTTICRWHGGQHTHLSIAGKVYFCGLGRQYYRHTRQLSEFLRPLQYPGRKIAAYGRDCDHYASTPPACGNQSEELQLRQFGNTRPEVREGLA